MPVRRNLRPCWLRCHYSPKITWYVWATILTAGPDAKAVVDLLLGVKAAEACRCTFLKGNHEDMFLDFLGYDGLYGQSFLMNGGDQTLASYQCDPWTPGHEVATLLPDAHRAFFLNLELYLPADAILCVHAGINPGLPPGGPEGGRSAVDS